MSKFTKKLISGLLAVASVFTLTAQLTFASEQKNDILYKFCIIRHLHSQVR